MKIQNTDTKCWWGCGAAGAFVYCWWQFGSFLFFKTKPKHTLPVESSNHAPRQLIIIVTMNTTAPLLEGPRVQFSFSNRWGLKCTFQAVCPGNLGKAPQWVFSQEARTPALSLWKTWILGIYWKVGTLKLSSLVGNGNGVVVLTCRSADLIAFLGAGVGKHCFPL